MRTSPELNFNNEIVFLFDKKYATLLNMRWVRIVIIVGGHAADGRKILFTKKGRRERKEKEKEEKFH